MIEKPAIEQLEIIYSNNIEKLYNIGIMIEEGSISDAQDIELRDFGGINHFLNSQEADFEWNKTNILTIKNLAVAYMIHGVDDEGDATLSQLYVSPFFRNLGIGSLLLNLSILDLIETGERYLIADVVDQTGAITNILKAQQFYPQYGNPLDIPCIWEIYLRDEQIDNFKLKLLDTIVEKQNQLLIKLNQDNIETLVSIAMAEIEKGNSFPSFPSIIILEKLKPIWSKLIQKTRIF